MASVCKGICTNYKAEKFSNKFRYALGQKRCTNCSLYLEIQSINCPCCGARLRSKARHRTE
ncbi:MAG: hypothetical protein ACKO7N_08415 [Candidatus Nitrosotenuis sp.]